MEMVERILATLIGFVVMMAVVIGLTLGAEASPLTSGFTGFVVFLLVYRAIRYGFRRFRKE